MKKQRKHTGSRKDRTGRAAGKGKPGFKRVVKEKGHAKSEEHEKQIYKKADEIRLNKFIAHSGFCSRREADEYIESGKVKINGKTVRELGVMVRRDDKVAVDGQQLSLEPYVYILLYKPKNTITTASDERGRDTVLDKVEDATGARVYPVGRLDRNTTGLLILTNDGDLTYRLTHPKFKVRKTYEAETERDLTDDELQQMAKGIELEDGFVKGHNIQKYTDVPRTVLISVFEGRNHLIRRMISHFGTEVIKLKRVEFAGLNLKDVRAGRWRYLRQEEINNLRKLVKLEPLDFRK